jgi:hypothetical protein
MAGKHLTMCTLVVLAILGLSVTHSQEFRIEVKPPARPDQVTWPELWSVTCDNKMGRDVDVVLKGYLFHQNNLVARGTAANTVRVPAGISDIRSNRITSIKDGFYAKDYEGLAVRGKLPAGPWLACIVAREANTSELLDSSCVRFDVRLLGAPKLMSPKDGAVLPGGRENPLFTWLAPSPKPSGSLSYVLTIVEVLPMQTAPTAMKDNRPVFKNAGITAANFKYSGTPLEKGKKYAWQIAAMVGRQNTGSSEVFAFSFEGTVPPPPETASIRLISPTIARPQKTERPGFSWKFAGAARSVTYDLTVRQLPDSGDLESGPAVLERTGIRGSSLPFPAEAPPLGPDRPYIWRVTATSNGRVVAASFWEPIITAKLPLTYCYVLPWPSGLWVCSGSPITLKAAVAMSGQAQGSIPWKLQLGGSVVLSGNVPANQNTALVMPLVPPPTVPGVYQYTLFVFGVSCNTASFTVTVYPKLTPSVAVPVGNPPGEICRGDNVQLSVQGLPSDVVIDHWEYSDDNMATWVTTKVPPDNLYYIAYGNGGNTLSIEPACPSGANFVTRWFRPVLDGAAWTTSLPTPWMTDCAFPQVALKVWCPTTAGSITMTPAGNYCRVVPGPYTVSLDISGTLPPPDNKFTWSYTGPQGALVSFSNTSIQNPTFTIDQASPPGVYTITVTVRNGICVPVEVSTSLTIQDPLTVSILGDKTHVCPNDDATIDVTHNGPDGTTVTWAYAVDVPGGWDDPNLVYTQSDVIGLRQNCNNIGDMGPYIPVPTYNICWRATVTQYPPICDPQYAYWKIKLVQPPCKPVISPNPVPVKCPEEAVTLTATTSCGDGPFTWRWLLDGYQIYPASGTTSDPTYPNVTAAGNYQVWVYNMQACDEPCNGCDSALSDPVKVVNCATSIVIHPDSCSYKKGATRTLSAEAASTCGGPYTYEWRDETGVIGTTQSITVTFNETTTITVTVWDGHNPPCPAEASITIKVCP